MSDHHVFTAISGFGLRVIPRAPFQARIGPTEVELDVEHGSGDGTRFAHLKADREGGYTSKLDQDTASLHDVLDVEVGPHLSGWHLDLGEFVMALPAGFSLHSVPASSSSPFDLCGPHDTLLYVQTPNTIPEVTQLVGPGQTVVDQRQTWIEVAYSHEGRRWWQRHEIALVGPSARLWFTAQAPEEHKDLALKALGVLLETLAGSPRT